MSLEDFWQIASQLANVQCFNRIQMTKITLHVICTCTKDYILACFSQAKQLVLLVVCLKAIIIFYLTCIFNLKFAQPSLKIQACNYVAHAWMSGYEGYKTPFVL